MSEVLKSPDPGRRQALKKMALGAGAACFPILGQTWASVAMWRAARSRPAVRRMAESDVNWKPLFFDEHQNETVTVLSDLIIPATDTPGAKAAFVNRYIDLVLNEEERDKQETFIEGLAWIDGRSLKLYGVPFVKLRPEQQVGLLTPLAEPDNHKLADQKGVNFFTQIKDFTVFAYYTSEIGMEQELEYGGDDYHTEYPGACTHPEHQS